MSEAFIPKVQGGNESEGVALGKLRKEQLLNLLKGDGWNFSQNEIH